MRQNCQLHPHQDSEESKPYSDAPLLMAKVMYFSFVFLIFRSGGYILTAHKS
jgi:hypothetical protein